MQGVSVLLVDPLSEDRGHLIEDDLYLSQCIAPLTTRYLAVTSEVSAANIRRHMDVETWSGNGTYKTPIRFHRQRLVRLAFSMPSRNFHDIIFQSFEEISTLLFMLLRPRKRVHLIVTNNLRPDRLKRHPVLGRFFLRGVFRWATSIIVHSQYEIAKILEIAPQTDARKIFIKPYHKIASPRVRYSWHKKSRNIAFMGPEGKHKQSYPIITLAKADIHQRFRYLFCGMAGNISPEMQSLVGCQANVEHRSGFLEEDDYGQILSEAAAIIMTHDRNYEGALSGVFCDAIAAGTPLIARDMAPHNEYFRRYGDMGFLVDYGDPRWHNRILTSELEKRYEEFQHNMEACRNACTREAIQDVFRKVLSVQSDPGNRS